jgi:hypothetical protein
VSNVRHWSISQGCSGRHKITGGGGSPQGILRRPRVRLTSQRQSRDVVMTCPSLPGSSTFTFALNDPDINTPTFPYGLVFKRNIFSALEFYYLQFSFCFIYIYIYIYSCKQAKVLIIKIKIAKFTITQVML